MRGPSGPKSKDPTRLWEFLLTPRKKTSASTNRDVIDSGNVCNALAGKEGMSSAGIVSLLKLLQAQLHKDPSRWTLAYKNLISRQKEARSGEQLSPARWNGIAYGALLSAWRAKGLAQRADALDIGLERLSRCGLLAMSGYTAN